MVVLTERAPATAARQFTAGPGWWDTSRVIVITPSRLAARAMGVRHRSLADVALAALAERGLSFAGALTRRSVLQAATLDSWGSADAGGTARAVESSVRELLVAGAGVAQVGSVEGFPRLSRLLELTTTYRRGLEARGLVDRAEALWLAAQGGSGAGGDPADAARGTVLVCGYRLLAPDELAFLSAYAAAGSVVVLPVAPRQPAGVAPDAFAPNEETAAVLADNGWLVVRDGYGADGTADGGADRGSDRGVSSGAGPGAGPGSGHAAAPERVSLTSATSQLITGYRLASVDAEVRFVLTAVKRLLLDGVAASDIALVAADPRDYGPAVVAVAHEYGLAVLPTYTVPLAATPVGHLAGSIAGVVAAGLPYEETARLLSHHLVRPLGAGAWLGARQRLPDGPVAWAQFDERVSVLQWPRRATRTAYTAALEAAMAGLGALEAVEADEESSGHLQVLMTTLAAYAASAGDDSGAGTQPSVSLATYVDELLDHLQLAQARWRGASSQTADPVALVAAVALGGATVDHVFVLGAAEGVLPARLDPGARLDFVDREAARAAGLLVTDATLAARREALTFDGVVRAARVGLTLTYPEARERAGQLPSPYFRALGLVPLEPGADGLAAPKPAASIEELRRYQVAAGQRLATSDPVLAAARRALAVESRRESGEPPDEYDGIVGEPYPANTSSFSATSLLALGQCTFKWFAQYAMQLYEPEEADGELSPLVRGNLYHRTLELAFKAAGSGRAIDRESVSAALPAAFAVAEEREARHTANWQHHRHQHLAALQRVVASESFLPEGTEVVGSETKFGARHGSPAGWRGFEVSGRIDRIDRRAGVVTLVDYKTSASKPLGVQDAAGEAKVDLQLPIYLEAAVPALGHITAGSTAGAAEAEYYSLTKAQVIAATSLSGENAFDRAALDAFAERAHRSLAQGWYPVRPDRAYRACAFCAFDAVCRVGPRVERKRSADG